MAVAVAGPRRRRTAIRGLGPRPAPVQKPAGAVVLELKDVHFTPRNRNGASGLTGINLTLCRGEIHHVIGDRQAGKSALLGLAAGFLRPVAGAVVRPSTVREPGLTQGKVRRVGASERRMLELGVVPSHPSLVARRSAFESAVLLLAMTALPMKAAGERARAHFQALHCCELATRPWGALTPAQAALMGLALASLGRPPLMIVDEPMPPAAELDPEAWTAALERLIDIWRPGLLACSRATLPWRRACTVQALCKGRLVPAERRA